MTALHNHLLPATGHPPVILAGDSREFLLRDIAELQAALTLLAHRIATEVFDPLPNPVWNDVLTAKESLCTVARCWLH
jgi:hypothetical protein